MAVDHVSWGSRTSLVILSLFFISTVPCAFWRNRPLVTKCVDGFGEATIQNAVMPRNFDTFTTCLSRRHSISPIVRKGFAFSRLNYYPNSVATFQAVLLLRGGDVDPNPGPCVSDQHIVSEQPVLHFNGLSTFYANSRSIMNKRNKLEPGIIVLIETHLDNSISDSEVLPNNYLVFRRDRKCNGQNGGGVLIAVRGHITATPRESLQTESEFVFIDIFFCDKRVITLGVFYQPSNEETKPFEEFQTALQNIGLRNGLG